MFGIRYMKASPTTYVLHWRSGRLKREGAGASFLYFAPTSTLVAVPLATADLPFAFQESTADFQTLTIQGQITYRVQDPKRLAALLDFSIDASGKHRSDDPESVGERLVHAAQVLTREVTGALPLRQALTSSEAIQRAVLDGLRNDDTVLRLGLEVLGLSVLAVRPTPEMARALEAEAREALQRRADEAIYSRRNAAVEQERKIKESELSTEIAVEEKKRQIRETQMAADISVEEQRATLIDRRVANERKDADSKAYALEASLKPLREMDWKTLLAIAAKGQDPKLMLAVAFRELAENAGKIGTLNITPDLLESLARPAAAGK